jgi:hypothetical protein
MGCNVIWGSPFNNLFPIYFVTIIPELIGIHACICLSLVCQVDKTPLDHICPRSIGLTHPYMATVIAFVKIPMVHIFVTS